MRTARVPPRPLRLHRIFHRLDRTSFAAGAPIRSPRQRLITTRWAPRFRAPWPPVAGAEPKALRKAAEERARNRYPLVAGTEVTSSVITLKPASAHGPNEVTMATSVASRPRAIRIRSILGLLCRASNVYQRPPR